MKANEILREAAEAIEERAKVRDLPEGERSMARATAAYRALRRERLETETDGWLFMVLLKAARATAGAYHPDDYTDMAAYAALAGEAAQREAEGRQESEDGWI